MSGEHTSEQAAKRRVDRLLRSLHAIDRGQLARRVRNLVKAYRATLGGGGASATEPGKRKDTRHGEPPAERLDEPEPPEGAQPTA
jgi:hypothetical protein